MQELLGRISRLDPSSSLGLRVIACFDELIVGNVNTRALLAAAAALAGCTAGFRQVDGRRAMRVTPKGQIDETAAPPQRDDLVVRAGEDLIVWLERAETPGANDAIILERLALSIRIRHGRGPRGLDDRRHLGVLTDRVSSPEDRLDAAGSLGLVASRSYRVVAAPLFAVWEARPAGPEDVIATRFGPIHAVVVPEHHEPFRASPCGLGVAVPASDLDRSFRSALVALRLCDPPREPLVAADAYGGLIDLLAEVDEAQHAYADTLSVVVEHSWALETVAALVTTQTVREAARMLNIHHSTLQARCDTLKANLGYDPLHGFGRTRLGTAFLLHRLNRSNVLDMPAPGST
ncbi:PucR family transcriptional regulator [Nocardioides daejeonensis]|uniref:PucR family transcriptional regulator n=1 Tax=Nocardioides daejeonensis TaxID=1046556 RepID=UPI000D74A716|nr:PucR family transcriptional regulator [Nocardioides daejeonensis]